MGVFVTPKKCKMYQTAPSPGQNVRQEHAGTVMHATVLTHVLKVTHAVRVAHATSCSLFNQPVLPLHQSQSGAQVGGASPRLPLKHKRKLSLHL